MPSFRFEERNVPKQVTAVIVNHNTGELLEKCLALIESCSFSEQIKTVVVDNASTDGSVELLQSAHPDVEVIALRQNVGFGRGNNAALKKLDTPYALLLNTDTFLEEDTVEKLAAYMEQNPDAGAAGPLVKNADGSVQASCRRFLTISSAFFHAFVGRIRPQNKRTREYMMEDLCRDDACCVDWISGCCMMLRREALESVGGGFDEQYFMYIEDVDLCWRLHQAGWRVAYVPQAQCTHLLGASGGYKSSLHIKAFHKGMWIFFRKRYKGTGKVLLFPLVYLGIQVRLAGKVAANEFKKLKRST